MKRIIQSVIIVFAIGIVACNHRSKPNSELVNQNLSTEKNVSDMNSYVSIFEIPATDISRAVNFYKEILGIEIERFDFPGMEMGLFPYQDQIVTGVIMKGDGYIPSSTGTTIYLNGGDNLQIILDKVEVNGGKIIIPKTPHADESGYFAIFHDSEGNKIGLHSPN